MRKCRRLLQCCQAHCLWDGRRGDVYKTEVQNKNRSRRNLQIWGMLGYPGGIQVGSNITLTMRGWRGEERIDFAGATLNTERASVSRLLSAKCCRCDQKIKEKGGWEKTNKQIWQWEGHSDFPGEQRRLILHRVEESNKHPTLWNSRLERSPGITWFWAALLPLQTY